MKRLSTFLFLVMLSTSLAAQINQHVDLLWEYDRGDDRYSGSWVFVGPDGTEYALLGAKTGTAVYDLDQPGVELGFIPGPNSNWREITVVGHHAYVVTEGAGPGSGLQVIDLSGLPNGIELVTTFDATFTRGHIIQKAIFEETPYVFVCGTTTTQGVHIIDISDPANPEEVGLYQPGYYIHDCHVRGNRLYAAAFYEGQLDVVDISDPTAPQLTLTIPDPGANTHSCSTNEDETMLFLADEQDGLPGRIFDIADLEDPQELSQYTAEPSSLVHNPYIVGDLCFITHNTEGLRVVDIADPALPLEVGFYDTYDGPSGGFSGLWSACPYLPSGRIIGGDRHRGLMVWEFNNTFAARIYGQVVDAVSGNPIPDAEVLLNDTDTLLLDGQATFGKALLPGNFQLTATATGYLPYQNDLELIGKDSIFITIALSPPVNGVAQLQQSSPKWQFVPNPAAAGLPIEISGLVAHQTFDIHVLDLLGQVRLTSLQVADPFGMVTLPPLQSGVFQVVLTNTNLNFVESQLLMVR
jgi:choice-of-anchor B domain-containing protein